jgi:hypothetical protein
MASSWCLKGTNLMNNLQNGASKLVKILTLYQKMARYCCNKNSSYANFFLKSGKKISYQILTKSIIALTHFDE